MNSFRALANRVTTAAVAFFGLAMAGLVQAQTSGPYDDITDAVDFSDVLGAVVAVAALVAAVLVGIRGVRWVLATVRR